MTQSSCKRDTKSKSHPSVKLAPVRVFLCKHPLQDNADVTNRQFCDTILFKLLVTVCQIKTTNKKQRLFM